MHAEAFQFMQRTLAKFGPRRAVVEIGARNINGSVRPLFVGCASYVGLDIAPGRGVDVVANGATWQPEQPVDCVCCCEVLEHTPEAAAIVANAYAMLREGGILVLTMAAPERVPHSAVDGGDLRPGEYYDGISPDEAREWLSLFEDVEIEHYPDRGDLYVVAVKP